MIVYIFAGVFLAVGMYLIVQRIRCNMAVKEKRKQLSDYNMKRIHLTAYDITYSYDLTNKWLSAHQMTINGKKSDISLADLLIAGEKMGLKKKKCMDIISKISLVVSNFESYAEEANIREKAYSEIMKILELNRVKM